MAETMESRIEARLKEFPEGYEAMRLKSARRDTLARVPGALLRGFRNIASQLSLEGLTYSLKVTVPYCVVTAAELSGLSAFEVAQSVRKRASGWLSLAGAGGAPTSRMMAAGFESTYEMGVGTIARLGVRAYRWEVDRTEEVADHLIKIAGVTLATALYFEAVRDDLPSRSRGSGEQLTLF